MKGSTCNKFFRMSSPNLLRCLSNTLLTSERLDSTWSPCVYCLRTGTSLGLKKAWAIPMPKMYTLASTRIFSFFSKSMGTQKGTRQHGCREGARGNVTETRRRFWSGTRREAEGRLQQTLQRDDMDCETSCEGSFQHLWRKHLLPPSPAK